MLEAWRFGGGGVFFFGGGAEVGGWLVGWGGWSWALVERGGWLGGWVVNELID